MWNAQRVVEGKPVICMGIGVHTGTAIVGEIGGAERTSFTVIGDSVNIASRIQDLTKEMGSDFLVSGDTWSRVERIAVGASGGLVNLKGKVTGVEVYKIVGLFDETGVFHSYDPVFERSLRQPQEPGLVGVCAPNLFVPDYRAPANDSVCTEEEGRTYLHSA